MPNITLKHTVYTTSTPGKTVVLIGGVHGNERCGPAALQALTTAIDSGVYRLERGRLIIAPICNPRAYTENCRFIERNLNRYLFQKAPEDRIHYEDHIDPLLCPLLEQADILLDLHSYQSAGNAFIFLGGKNPEETAFARDIGINDFVSGWSDAYGSPGKDESTGTTEYARQFGALAATLECGQHFNENAAEVGFNACVRALRHAGLISADSVIPEKSEHDRQRLVKMHDVFHRPEGGVITKNFTHFDTVNAGDVIVHDTNGKALYTAPADGYIVLPKTNPPIGTEWFYFGKTATFA